MRAGAREYGCSCVCVCVCVCERERERERERVSVCVGPGPPCLCLVERDRQCLTGRRPLYVIMYNYDYIQFSRLSDGEEAVRHREDSGEGVRGAFPVSFAQLYNCTIT